MVVVWAQTLMVAMVPLDCRRLIQTKRWRAAAIVQELIELFVSLRAQICS